MPKVEELTGQPGFIVRSGSLITPGGDQGIPGVSGSTGPVGATGPMGQGITVKGTVPTYTQLPATGNTQGDMWITLDTGHGWTWSGTGWVDTGPVQGPVGPTGPPGTAATCNAGTTTTLSAGSNASVTNIGTTSAAVFNFGIPAGIQGLKGDTGPQGIQGIQGVQGVPGYDGNLVGTIFAWPSVTPPNGYLLCDGTAYSRSTFAALFAIIGTTYGIGDGSTTFNVPDLRSKTIVGYGDGGANFTMRNLADSGGEENHTLITAELAAHAHVVPAHGHGWNDNNHANLNPAHGHGWTNNGHTHTVAADSATRTGVTQGSYGSFGTVQTSTTSGENQVVGSVVNAGQFWTGGVNVVCGSVANAGAFWDNNTGSDAAHNNMPPYLCLNYIIRAGLGISVGPTVPIADTTQPGLLTKVSGLMTDYIGGDNACHNLSSISPSKGFVLQTAAYTITPLDSGKYIICSGGSWTLTLPPPAGSLFFQVRNDMGISGTTGIITIQTSGGTIDGQTSISLLAQQDCTILTDGTNWRTLGLKRELVLGSINAASVANQTILLPPGYTAYELNITRLVAPSGGTPNLQMQCSLDGTTFPNAGYYGCYYYNNTATAVIAGTYGSTTANALYITHWLEASMGRHVVNATIYPGDAATEFSFIGESGAMYNGFVGTFTLSGFYNATGKAVAIRLVPSSGTFSGQIIFKGVA